MNRYLVFGLGALFGVLLVVVGVFVYLQLVLKSSSVEPAKTTEPASVDASPAEKKVKAPAIASEGGTETGDTPAPLVRDPIPLSKLPLNDTQKKLISGLGIDYDTFMITPEMVDCAEGRLGRGRVEELIGGAAPSFSELTSLSKCL